VTSGTSRRFLALAIIGFGLLLGGLAMLWAGRPSNPSVVDATSDDVLPPPPTPLAAHHVDTSALRDLHGNQRSLASIAGKRATVLVFLGVECPLANLYVPQILELEKHYRDAGVHFVAVYSHENELLITAAAHALERDIPFTVVKDFGQRLADSLGVTRTPTVCLIDSEGGLQYRGRISDQYGVNSRRPTATREDLRIGIDELLAGQTLSVATTDADGCLLDRHRAKPASAPPTFADVAPILSKRCATCHRSGQAAPFALADYDDAVQWSKMIREVVSERRMPPWHADPRYGHFANDRSLSQDEIDKLLAWIDGGMVRGNAQQEVGSLVSAGEWGLGTPTAVVSVNDGFQVPAEGVLSYDYLQLKSSVTDELFDRDRWVQAAELKPSNPSVVHHMTLAIMPPGVKADPSNPVTLPMLAAWAPGDPFFRYPPGTALRIPKGSSLLFEVHHVPNGTATLSRPSVAFTITDDPPEREVRLATHDHLSLNLPPGDPHYRAETQSTFAVDALILGLYPHAHFRGKAFNFEATYPDGTQETLLSVPRFDFNWQTFYWLSEPKRVPAGTQLTCVCYYDNSRYNLNNPNPAANVRTGSQSTDEMMVGWVFFVAEQPEKDGTANELLVPDRAPQVVILEEELRTEVAANSENLDARLRLAHALYSREQWDAAVTELQEILRREHKHAPARHALGRIAERQNDDEAAIEHFRAALAIVPQQADWLNDLGMALVRLERYDEAVASYELGLKHANESAILHSNLAFAYLKLDRALAAAVQARAALKIEPDLAAAHANLGLALAEQNELEEAVAELRRSLLLKPDVPDLQLSLGRCLLAAKRPLDAVKELNIAIDLAPESGLAYSERGLALAQLGRLDEATADFRSAIERNDSLPDAHFYLGQCLAASGSPSEAVDEYHRALELKPAWAAAANNLAWLLATHPDANVRNGAEAVRLAEMANNDAAQEDPGALDTLAAAYAEAGRFDDAVRTMQRVIDLAAARVDEATRQGMSERLKLYQSKQPYRESAVN